MNGTWNVPTTLTFVGCVVAIYKCNACPFLPFGVIATLHTTLEPTADLVQRCAVEAGKNIRITARLCNGAFEALMSGDAAKHYSMVSTALRELMCDVDVIDLAQASMARVVDALAEGEKRVPILASPPLAIDYLATVL